MTPTQNVNFKEDIEYAGVFTTQSVGMLLYLKSIHYDKHKERAGP